MEIFSPPLAGFQGLAGRNLLRNGNGTINQRAVSGTVTLAAGAYGHDGFKAGANGCTYTFATSGADTVFTITAGSLIQVIEPANVFATAVWLGWFGTSTARIWQGSAAGTFAVGTPVSMRTGTINTLLVTGLSLATATAAEFGIGSLGYVQCEEAIPGLGPTPFERRQIGVELMLCQRYYQIVQPSIRFYSVNTSQTADCSAGFAAMRAIPTTALVAVGARSNVASAGLYSTSSNSGRFEVTSSAVADTYALVDTWALTAEL